jgi:lysophospholipase L1-like esterase
LLIGTNDRFPEEETVKNINLIVSGLLQKKAWNRVYLMTILPRNDSYDERNIRVNQKIRDWVAQTGSDRIRLIDAEIGFRNLPNWRELLPDGLHPSDEGYWQLIEIIFRGGQ